jgi:formylglycine-generating enzyme required for sulfatase activity
LSSETGKKYRLPSEAEWEYACRAGTTTAHWWGDKPGKNHANFDGSRSKWSGKQTSPVGSFKENPFGVYDTLGNVCEWVEDRWHDNYKGAPTDGSAWVPFWNIGHGHAHVLRGGSWGNEAGEARSASRNYPSQPVGHGGNIGFRLARDL